MTGSQEFRRGRAEEIRPLIDVIRRYTSGMSSALGFVLEFRSTWGDQRFVMPEELFTVLSRIFYATEDFVADESLREHGDLGPTELLSVVAELEPELIARFDEACRREADHARPSDS